MSGPEDRELIIAWRKDDSAAFEMLVDRHYPRVYAICLGMVGQPADAEDVAQDTFIKAFHQLGSLRDDGQFRPWVNRIAKNLCVDFLRRKKHGQQILADRVRPEEDECRAEDGELAEAIEKLPMELRLPLVMYYFIGHNTRSIAEELDISHASACQRLREARKELHRRLTEGGRS